MGTKGRSSKNPKILPMSYLEAPYGRRDADADELQLRRRRAPESRLSREGRSPAFARADSLTEFGTFCEILSKVAKKGEKLLGSAEQRDNRTAVAVAAHGPAELRAALSHPSLPPSLPPSFGPSVLLMSSAFVNSSGEEGRMGASGVLPCEPFPPPFRPSSERPEQRAHVKVKFTAVCSVENVVFCD